MPNTVEPHKNITLKEGENCWRRSHIQDGAFILSGQEFFRAFRKALLQAERYVYILAWDLSESIELVRDDGFDDGHPTKMNDFVFSVLEAKPQLEIFILLWDYSLVYLTEREWLPFTEWRKKDQPRLHLKADDEINIGASHHQKVIVVDDKLAFCGGYDLSAWRWDTREHLPHDTRRTHPAGELYQPYHDVHLVVTGDVAKDLGDLCDDRWLRATGDNLPRQKSSDSNISLPKGISSDFGEIEVGIALTYSAYKSCQAVCQIERMYLDIIKLSQQYIYIENQYLSSHTIVNALCKRLQEAEGPEIILVLTKKAGWLEEKTLGLLRDRLLEKLVKADQYGRFSSFYPYVTDESGNESQVYVHAKILLADDRTLVVGSANLSNRSMKVDSEVNLIVNQQNPRDEIKNLLQRLFGIHFKCSNEAVTRAFKAEKSLHGVIKNLGDNNPHRLMKLETEMDSPLLRKLAATQLLDPGEPLSPAHWMRETIEGSETENSKKSNKHSYIKWVVILLIGLFMAWGFNTLWSDVLDKETIMTFLENFRASPFMIPIVFGLFMVAGLVAAPINILLVASTVAIGPWVTFGCGLAGSLFSAAVAYYLGSRFGKPLIKKVAKKQLEKLSRQVSKQGILSVVVIRLVPIAPFVIVNLVAGSSNISFTTFFFGSILGMVPGMFGVVWVTHTAQSAFTDPQWQTWLLLGCGLAAIGVVVYLLRQKFK